MTKYRKIIRIDWEAVTPIYISSGRSGLLRDSLVQKDYLGLPMIPGTALAGVIRHEMQRQGMQSDSMNAWWGSSGSRDTEGQGSLIMVSSAYLIGNANRVCESQSEEVNQIAQLFENLPVRDHVRIDVRGTAEKGGKYDHEIVHKGCRWRSEIEIRGEDMEQINTQWQAMVTAITSPLFRIGQGTRNGYGHIVVIACDEHDLIVTDDQYINWSSSLNEQIPSGKLATTPKQDSEMKSYLLDLSSSTPTLFHFGAGYADAQVDAVPVTEHSINYIEGRIQLSKCAEVLIPGSSVKGALRHRTVYHMLKGQEKFAESTEDYVKLLTEVDALFGRASSDDAESSHIGSVIIDDVYCRGLQAEKILNHVQIDRFTGGAKDGALYSEKVAVLPPGESIQIRIQIAHMDKIPKEQLEAFESAMTDITTGLLPLGGLVTRGHGIFTGTLETLTATTPAS